MRKLLAVLFLATAPSLAGAQYDFSLNTLNAGDIAAAAPLPGAAACLPAAPDQGPRETVPYRGFEIQGSTTFIAATEAALDLLAGSPASAVVAPYISVIEQADRSGMVAWTARPVFQVGNSTWRHSAHWYAGVIAHDGMHSLLYHTADVPPGTEPPPEAWTGEEAERACLRVQAEVLAEIKADKYMIDYVSSLIDDPAYHLIPYEDRDW